MNKTKLTTALLLATAIGAACATGDDASSTNLNVAGNTNRSNSNTTAVANTNTQQQNISSSASPLSTASDHSHTPNEGARRISIAEARELSEQGKALFVDVRSADAYRQSHIKGAILMAENEVAQRTKELPKDKLIITYCA